MRFFHFPDGLWYWCNITKQLQPAAIVNGMFMPIAIPGNWFDF